MSVRVGNTLISPLVNNGGGSILTITITPQQGGYDSFTWSGATTQQIADAFAAGTTIKLNYGSDGVYDVDQLRTFTSGANINVIATYLADYDTTIETQLFYDGTGEQFDTDFYTDSQVDNLLAGKQDTLTAGTGISINNNVISATGGGGASTLTIAVTYDQQEDDAFTWSGATISEIESAYNSGTEIYIPTRYMGTVKVTSLSGDSQEVYMTTLYTGYQTCTFLLKSDGTGEVFWYELAQGQTLQDVEDSLSTRINNKQDKLTAGSNITISGNTISATNTTYTAGNNITISNGTISATDTTYTAGTGISIANNVISATGTGSTPLILTITPDQQTEGNFTWTGATIEEIHTTFDSGAEVLISVSGTVYRVTAVRYTTTVAELSATTDAIHTLALRLYPNGQGESLGITLVYSETLAAALATKQNTLTAGTGISITNGVISCTFANGNGVSY